MLSHEYAGDRQREAGRLLGNGGHSELSNGVATAAAFRDQTDFIGRFCDICLQIVPDLYTERNYVHRLHGKVRSFVNKRKVED